MIESILFAVAIASWTGSELWISIREWGTLNTEQDRHTKTVIAACMAAALVIGVWGPRPPQYTIFWARNLMTVLGSLTILLGVTWRVFSVLALGNYFRTTVMVQKGQKVVQTGPYKYIRHPSYLGILISVSGLGIAEDNWFTMLLMIAVVFYGLRKRILVEEEVLERELGTKYAEYKRRTKRLIPGLY
jgi:protein-S-isoprenylcysteine O-methyltransferase Ste14